LSNIKTVAAAALPSLEILCAEWLPHGKREGREYKVGDLQGSPGSSTSINLDTGRWADFAADVKGGDAVSLYAAIHNVSQREAADRIAERLGIADTPEHPNHGVPQQVWQYPGHGFVARFDTADGKVVIPYDSNLCKWKSFPKPRPLYNLSHLIARPDAPVVIVEGEKTADAAAKLFPHAVCITWAGGCKAAKR
jgi:hypothetical protein